MKSKFFTVIVFLLLAMFFAYQFVNGSCMLSFYEIVIADNNVGQDEKNNFFADMLTAKSIDLCTDLVLASLVGEFSFVEFSNRMDLDKKHNHSPPICYTSPLS